MDAYSDDLRQRVVQACDDGVLTREEIAEHFKVSTAWIRRLLQLVGKQVHLRRCPEVVVPSQS